MKALERIKELVFLISALAIAWLSEGYSSPYCNEADPYHILYDRLVYWDICGYSTSYVVLAYVCTEEHYCTTNGYGSPYPLKIFRQQTVRSVRQPPVVTAALVDSSGLCIVSTGSFVLGFQGKATALDPAGADACSVEYDCAGRFENMVFRYPASGRAPVVVSQLLSNGFGSARFYGATIAWYAGRFYIGFEVFMLSMNGHIVAIAPITDQDTILLNEDSIVGKGLNSELVAHCGELFCFAVAYPHKEGDEVRLWETHDGKAWKSMPLSLPLTDVVAVSACSVSNTAYPLLLAILHDKPPVVVELEQKLGTVGARQVVPVPIPKNIIEFPKIRTVADKPYVFYVDSGSTQLNVSAIDIKLTSFMSSRKRMELARTGINAIAYAALAAVILTIVWKARMIARSLRVYVGKFLELLRRRRRLVALSLAVLVIVCMYPASYGPVIGYRILPGHVCHDVYHPLEVGLYKVGFSEDQLAHYIVWWRRVANSTHR